MDILLMPVLVRHKRLVVMREVCDPPFECSTHLSIVKDLVHVIVEVVGVIVVIVQ